MALLLSMALVLHYIEHFFPPLAPGAKLGLANIVTIISLHLFGFSESMAIVLLRSILGPLLGGSPTAIMYSMAGGVLSCIVMAVLYYKFNKYFSLMGNQRSRGCISQYRPAADSFLYIWFHRHFVYLYAHTDGGFGFYRQFYRPGG